MHSNSSHTSSPGNMFLHKSRRKCIINLVGQFCDWTHNIHCWNPPSIQLMVRREEMAPLPPRPARLRLMPDHWWTSREGPWRGLHLHSSITGHRLPRSNMEDPWANLSLGACPRSRVRFRLLIWVFKVKILLTNNTQWLKYIVRVIYAWFTVMTISVSMRVPFQNKTCQDIVPIFLFRKSHHSFITLSKMLQRLNRSEPGG